MVNEAIIYDNGGPEPRLILEIQSPNLARRERDLSVWARHLFAGVDA